VASGLMGAIALLEHYDLTNDSGMINLTTTDREWMRNKDVIGDYERSVVKIFKK